MRLFCLISILVFSCHFNLVSQISVGELSLENAGGPAPVLPGDPAINQVLSVVNEVEEKQNFVDNLLGDSTLTLPFGIIKQKGATRYVIAIDSMRFEETGAYFSAFAAVDFPGSEKKLAFRGSGIKFNPKGVIPGEQSRLYLASNHTIRINSTVSLKLNANNQNWIGWDCSGFKAISLSGSFVFSGSKLLPDPSQTSDSTVTASFQIYTEDIHDFITTVSISPFIVKGIDDWSFTVTNAVVDMSELANTPVMTFPAGYNDPNLLTPQMWTGFYLQNVKVKLPRELSPPGKRSEIDVSNLLIDNTGVCGNIAATNVFNLSQGSMSGWGFSIEQLGASFVQNKLSAGFIKGRIAIPAFESGESLAYNASMNYNYVSKELGYQFIVSPASNLTLKAFSANVTLNQNSSITVVKSGSTFKPSANLNGTIAFNTERFNSNNGRLAFQNLLFNSEAPYIHSGIFSLNNINNTQNKVARFPVSVNSVSIGVNNGAPVLGFQMGLNLSDQASNSLGVAAGILIRSKIEPGTVTYPVGNRNISFDRPEIKFDKVSVTDISIDIQTSPFTLQGQLAFRDDDPVYGDGYFGSLAFSIPSVMSDKATSSVAFGAKDTYRYFYVDAKVPVSFILGHSGIKVTRLTGGLYRHMKPGKTTMSEFIALNQAPVTTGNALTYVPDQTFGMGFKAGVSYEFAANEVPFNGELMLGLNFNSSGGLSNVGLQGDIYSMTKKVNRANAPVKGAITISYDVPTKAFDAQAQVIINVQNKITGTGYFNMHIDPQVWFVCVGKPSQPNTINIGNIVTSPSYFMVGNSLEPPMQAPPEVTSNPSVASVLGNRDQSQLQSGGGFCAGVRVQAGINKNFGFSFFQVSAAMNFVLGFDMMLANYGENAVCQGTNDKVGVNGWQAQGNMYLAFNANVSVSGSLKLVGDCPHYTEICLSKYFCYTLKTPCIVNTGFNQTVFSAGVCSVISAKVPKPLYMAGNFKCDYNILGRVSGSFYVDFEYGTDCTPVML